MPKLIDIHAHLNFAGFGTDALVVLQKTLDQDVWVINIGADMATSIKSVETAHKFETGIYASVGLHPTEVVDILEKDWSELVKLAYDDKVVTIGECGLEYFNLTTDKDFEIKKLKQKEIFRKHIELAIEVNKPLMIHCRPSKGSQDSYEEAIEILSEYQKKSKGKLKANFHFFAGNLLTAQKCLDLGFTVSFTGVITFTNDYDEVIKNIPSDMIMVETDSPYVSPVPYRGKRCEPLYVSLVVKKIAELRGVAYDEIAKITVENAKRLFGI